MLYLDTAATTPVDPHVAEVVLKHLTIEFGNAGSRTHEWGSRAKRALQDSRERIAALVSATPDEVVFTSGATESDNLALLGLAEYGQGSGRTHILTSATEHKAVLEPLEELARRGFEVEFLPESLSGRHEVNEVMSLVRDNTLAVSVMQVNNETGVIQPVEALASRLRATGTYLHVDAAQGFAKPMGESLAEVDLISITGHKIGAPKGIGALITRRRGWSRIPLTPLMFGGGQERKLRPGTVPVAMVVGLAEAADRLSRNSDEWQRKTLTVRRALIASLEGIPHHLNGDQAHCAPHIANLSFTGIDSEALIVAVKDSAAIATGSACTSASYTPSHVLTAMGLSQERIQESVRLSWWSDTDTEGIAAFTDVVRGLSPSA